MRKGNQASVVDKSFKLHLVVFLLFQLAGSYSALYAQQQDQLWLEVQTSYPFANQYLLENTTTYQTLMSNEDKWRSLAISPTFEYVFSPRLDLLSEIGISYTNQKESASSFEVAPMVGGRFHITQGKRIDVRFVWRYQARAFKEIEANDWEISNRTRLRGEIFYSINGPNLFTDKLLYAFGDYEEFVVLDQQLDERFANRRRARIGIGYRLSYRHRFDFGYTIQSSRNEIEGEFISTDNVIQLKYKMFFNETKKSSLPDD